MFEKIKVMNFLNFFQISEKTGTVPANADSQVDQDFQVADRIDAITDDFATLGAEGDTFDAIGQVSH